MAKPMTESDLNDLVHQIADVLDEYLDEKVCRYRLNDRISAMVDDYEIEVVPDDI